jgi:hypothetical protein
MDVVNHVVALSATNRVLRTAIRRIFPVFTWRIRLCCTLMCYALLYRTTVLFSDRVLGHNLCLDRPHN